jgi:hypothetical protein
MCEEVVLSEDKERVTLNFEHGCSAGWEDMEGDDRMRHFYTCDQKVHNLSAMTEHEAAIFLDQFKPGERFCTYERVDVNGDVIFAQPRGPRLPSPPRLTTAAAALSLPMLLAGCSSGDEACDTAVAQEPGNGEPSIFNDPHHPRHSTAAYSKLPEHRRSLLLRILRSNPVQRKFEESNAQVGHGGARYLR